MAIVTDQLIKDSLIDGNGSISPVSKMLLTKLAEKDGQTAQEFDILLKEKLKELYSHKDIQDQFELQKCPNCGSNVPLISKVCEFCNTMFKAPEGSDISEEKLLENIDLNIEILRLLPKQNFIRSFFSHWYILFPGMIAYLFFMLLRFEEYYLFYDFDDIITWLIIIFVFLIAVMGIRTYLSRNKPSQNPQKYLADYEKFSRMTRHYYGGNTKIIEHLNNFHSKIDELEVKNKTVTKNRVKGYLILIIVISALTGTMYLLTAKDFRDRSTISDRTNYFSDKIIVHCTNNQVFGLADSFLEVEENAYSLRIGTSSNGELSLWLDNVKLSIKDNTSAEPDSEYNLKVIIEDEEHKALYETLKLLDTDSFNKKFEASIDGLIVDFRIALPKEEADNIIADLKQKAKYFSIHSFPIDSINEE